MIRKKKREAKHTGRPMDRRVMYRILGGIYIVGGGSRNDSGERGYGWEDGYIGAAWTNTKDSEEEDSTSGRGMMIGQVLDVRGRFCPIFGKEKDELLATTINKLFNGNISNQFYIRWCVQIFK